MTAVLQKKLPDICKKNDFLVARFKGACFKINNLVVAHLKEDTYYKNNDLVVAHLKEDIYYKKQ